MKHYFTPNVLENLDEEAEKVAAIIAAHTFDLQTKVVAPSSPSLKTSNWKKARLQ